MRISTHPAVRRVLCFCGSGLRYRFNADKHAASRAVLDSASSLSGLRYRFNADKHLGFQVFTPRQLWRRSGLRYRFNADKHLRPSRVHPANMEKSGLRYRFNADKHSTRTTGE